MPVVNGKSLKWLGHDRTGLEKNLLGNLRRVNSVKLKIAILYFLIPPCSTWIFVQHSTSSNQTYTCFDYLCYYACLHASFRDLCKSYCTLTTKLLITYLFTLLGVQPISVRIFRSTMKVIAFAFILFALLAAPGKTQRRNSFTGQSSIDEAPFTSFTQFNRRFRNRGQRRPIEEACIPSRRVQTYSGFCNNLRNPNYGKSHTSFLIHSHVVDYDPSKLPNARLVSNTVCREDTTPPNRRRMSELVTFMGQFIDHTLTETENSKDPWPISIPYDDPVYNYTKRGEIQFFRSLKERRGRFMSPLNILSSFIDLDVVYGNSKTGAAILRINKDGLLKENSEYHLTKNPDGFYVSGDGRVNENPNLTALHTLFNREHNAIAREVKYAYPWWDDERIFQMARKVNIAQFQAIVYYGFIPAVTGRRLPRYRGYRRRQNAGITNEFSTVAFRVGHTLINKHLTSIPRYGKPEQILLRDAFFKPKTFDRIGMESLFRGMMRTRAAEVDNGVVTDVRDFLVNNGRTMLDLASLNIQRGRDHGVPRYNDVRRAYRLPPARTFADITSNLDVQEKLKKAYGTVTNVDAWVGGVCEDHVRGGSLGPLFFRIWRHQFNVLRFGDRFFFERPRLFRPRQIWKIRTLRRLYWSYGGKSNAMRRVILRNTNLKWWELKWNPFFAW